MTVVDYARNLGERTAFYGSALASTGERSAPLPGGGAAAHRRHGYGHRALAVIGGTVVIIGFLTLSPAH